jgi:beta-glucosidase
MADSTAYEHAFQNPDLSIAERVDDLVSKLDVVEKASQMLHTAPAIPRLGIPAYSWWNECLHGVARAGVATVFPQAIGLAAMWNVQLLSRIAVAVSDEARAKHHEFVRKGDRGLYKGLTFWAPNINIFRDPRWGRGHETYGECPFLTSRLGVAFCQGLQGDDPNYLKTVATPKHFAVHSGPEGQRRSFDAVVTEKDLRETYLPAFHACVTEAKAQSIMGAYNRINGEVCCGSQTLLVKILRDEWKFDGYVVSDCWAVRGFHEHHHVTAGWEESAALAIKAGCDLNCGCSFEHLPQAVTNGLITEAEMDTCLKRLFRARIQLGMFDPPERVPYTSIPYEVNDCAEHRELAREAARQSIVLLKNEGGLLPLSPEISSIAVIGPNANSDSLLAANYHGIASKPVTPLEGIRSAVSKGTRVLYADGCKLTGTATDGLERAGNLSEALSVAERAEVVVLCLGLSADIEGEQGDTCISSTGDKIDLALTGLQQRLMEEVVAVGKPTVLVLLAGSALSISWAEAHVDAIIDAFYPGGEGGDAIADVLFGKVSPAGRLPITFPRSIADVPAFSDYSMKGRTYRFLEREPLYPFGYGLSYTRFEYSEIRVSATKIEAGRNLEISVAVKNLGEIASDEVVQLYVKDLEASCRVAERELRGFERISLAPSETKRVTFKLNARDLSLIEESGQRVLEPGRFRLYVGGSQPDARSVALVGQAPLEVDIEVVGRRLELPY